MRRVLGFAVGLLVGMPCAFATTQTGRDQCRGLNDPGTVSFPVAFSSLPTVTCTPAAFLAESCVVLFTSTTQFTFECKDGSGNHKAGPMTWSASN